MEPRMCLTIHNPPKFYGDCIRACIATLTDDDEVPHVFNDKREPEESWKQLRCYLKSKGKFLFLTSVDSLEDMAENNPGIPYMMICGTTNGNHAVLCQDGEIIHNPAYYKSEITGPPEGMKEYVIGFVGNLV